MTPDRWLAATALLLGGLAAIAGEPYAPNSGQVDVNVLAQMIAREQDHVDAADLARWINEHKPGLRVVDLRSPEEFTQAHVPSAENLSLEQLGQARFADTDTVVLYSQGGTHAAQAWVLMRALGLRQVFFLSGGLDEWQKAGPAPERRVNPWRRGC